jgi:ParB-like chromosome segregation protein Spo0J
MKLLGLLNPIIVTENFKVVDGDNRVTCAKLLQWIEIEGIIVKMTDAELMQHALLKPVHKIRCTNAELGNYLQRLMKIHGFSLEEAAEKVKQPIHRLRRWLNAVKNS